MELYTASTPIFHLHTLERWINKDIAKLTEDADYEGQQLHGLNRIASNCIKRSDLERFAMNTTEETEHSEKNPDHSRDDVGSSLGTIIRAIIPWKASSARSARSKEMPAATWVGFFEKVGLDKIKPRGHLGTRRVIADYLPSDLVAAPAYAQIGVIVTAAATHGAATHIIDHQSDYPVILGPTFKFEFRQHPILGAVGAYSDFLPNPNHKDKDPRTTLGDLGASWLYDKTKKGKEQKARKEALQTIPSLSRLRVALLHARGTIETNKGAPFHTIPLARGSDPQRITALNLLNGQHRVQTLKFMLAISKEQMNASSQESFILDYGELSEEQYMPVVSLFLASTPRHVPALFPTDMLSKRPPLTTLALNGHYWTEVTSEDVRGDDMSNWPLSLKPPSWEGVQWLRTGMAEIGLINRKSYDAYVEKARHEVDQQVKRGENETPNPIVFKVVLHLCLKMLHNAGTFRTWFVDYPPEMRSYLRYITLLQLELLDRWFMGQPRENIESRAILICNTTITLMLAANIASDKEDMVHSTPNTGKGSLWNHHSRTIRWLDDFLKSLGLTDATLNEAHRSWNIQRSCDRKSLSISAADEPKRNASEGPGETLAPLASQWKPFDSELKRLVCTVYNKEWELFNTHQLLNRLAKVVELGLDQTYRKWRPAQVAGEDQSTKTIDDLVIYRCILVFSMLFQTAPDNSDLRRSGLWEQVVAII